MKRLILTCLVTLAFVACGGKKDGGTTDGGDPTGDGNGGGGDGGGTVDAPPFGGNCDPSFPECSDCADNDGDGDIDGFDVECTGPFDDNESSFATGIPGDNMDAVNQDCFFDGNSGAGNDGCNIHVCCLLGAQTVADCPVGANQYDPNACPPPIGTGTLSQQCIDTCGKLAPPGCDCFGCCTICDPQTNMCFDIDINPAVSPTCDASNISDPNACKRCVKSTTCGNGECGGSTCILCPGQDPNDLPPECSGTMCPTGTVTCGTDGACPDQTYCSNGCCIGVLQ
ncbi:MAG TPA: hypothetical protein VFQ53_15480 [Kofleriaceae bacterium]|nr:hypothetical protein [Kofleriaceae bacterium]